MHPNSLKTNSLLLGAALAGLSGISTETNAATVLTETTDFSNLSNAPTDLSATWSDFVALGGIVGQISPGSGDIHDFVLLSATANSSVSIPFTVTSSVANPYFGFFALNGGTYLGGVNLESMPNAGQKYSGVLTFTVPASGKVTIGTSHEIGSGTLSYTLGATVPEASTSMLGLAGLAAAALKRRRQNS